MEIPCADIRRDNFKKVIEPDSTVWITKMNNSSLQAMLAILQIELAEAQIPFTKLKVLMKDLFI